MISRRKTRNASETNARFIANRRPQENKSVCTVKDTDRGRSRIRLLPFFMPQATRKRRTNTAQSSADFCSRQKSAENRFRPNNKRFFQPSKKCDFLNENSVKKSQMTAVCALGYKQAAALRAADQAHTLPTNRTISGLTALPYLTGCASLYTHGEKARREAEPSPLTRSGSAAAVPAAFAFYPTFYLFYSPSMDPAINFSIGGASVCPYKASRVLHDFRRFVLF